MERFLHSYEGVLTTIEGRIAGSWQLTDPATGAVYAVSQKGSSGGCRVFEVNVLSPGGTLPILSRGNAYRC